MKSRVIFIVLLIVGVAAAVWWYPFQPAEEPAVAERTLFPDPGIPPQPRHPLPETQPEPSPPAIEGDGEAESEQEAVPAPEPDPLPELEESDPYLTDLLAGIVGDEAVTAWLITDRIAERTVVFINSLDDLPVPVELRPIAPVPGEVLVAEEQGQPYWSGNNFARYQPFIEMMDAVSPAEAASLYIRNYPLFQEAYAALVPETRFFNDRLVEIIDHLSGMPTSSDAEFALEPYEAVYRYADVNLEEASSGHKLLMRIGPDNAETALDWLMRFRAEITGG